MGQNHMLALGYDKLTQVGDGGSGILHYAVHILEPLKDYLVEQGKKIFKQENRHASTL